ncbi:TrmH family RNA methyltransferase [Aestuariivivens sediminicola]|uniref:TrmH family RNA methyltransferase n=1 Tax=Aestuariivivens sediminicola TaxID=2913560 RepID=UPI001F578072|nr:RNA methyltransferase [Aestuariivivens sediminicola]
MSVKLISSITNPLVRQLVQLKYKSRERKKTGLFVIEGQREIELALKGSYSIDTLLYVPELFSAEQVNSIADRSSKVIEISREVYGKLAYRDSTQGVLALAKAKHHTISELVLQGPSPLILVAEAPEKPGNIGALLRTADAAKVDAVIIANPKTDLYNPNIIRSSVGCIFTNPIATGETSEIIDFLKGHEIKIYCAALQASVHYHTQDFRQPTAIVVGTEDSGLSPEWLKHSDQNIIIPMHGEIDSMNVSVAAGILIFEAKRQRMVI